MDLQSVKNAVNFVKKALGDAKSTPIFAHYVIQDQCFYATDGNVLAGCPVNWDADCLYPASEFEAVINRLPSDPKVVNENMRSTFRAGKFSGTVPYLPSDSISLAVQRYGDPIPLTPDFHSKFKRVASFIQNQDDVSWMTAVNIAKGKMVTTNRGQVMAVVDYPELESLTLSIPKRAVELIASKVPPVSLALTGNGSNARFRYEDGAFLATNLLAADLPAILFKRLEEVDTKYQKTFELTPDWKDAYLRVAGLSDDEILLYPDRIVGTSAKTPSEEEATTPIREGREFACYNPKFLTQVVENAHWFDPSVFPDAAPWWGDDGMRGLVVGKMA